MGGEGAVETPFSLNAPRRPSKRLFDAEGPVQSWVYAERGKGGVQATELYLQPDGSGASFGYLCRNIQRFFQAGIAPYPAERTLPAPLGPHRARSAHRIARLICKCKGLPHKKNRRGNCSGGFCMVGDTGFEPVASGM